MAKLVFKGKEDFGTLGERTPLRDRYGRVLHIGDVVLVATSGAHMFNIVVKDKEQGYFVMGWGHKDASKKDRRSFEDIIRVDDPSLTEILETKYANIIELVEELPKQNKVDTIEFKIEDKKTIVNYNGVKGVAQCHPTKDEYNKEIGITLATMRALGIDEGKVRDCADILLGVGKNAIPAPFTFITVELLIAVTIVSITVNMELAVVAADDIVDAIAAFVGSVADPFPFRDSISECFFNLAAFMSISIFTRSILYLNIWNFFNTICVVRYFVYLSSTEICDFESLSLSSLFPFDLLSV